MIKTDDFVGDIMFQNDSDEECNQYIDRLKDSEIHNKKNFKEEVKEIWGKASEFSKKVRYYSYKILAKPKVEVKVLRSSYQR